MEDVVNTMVIVIHDDNDGCHDGNDSGNQWWR